MLHEWLKMLNMTNDWNPNLIIQIEKKGKREEKKRPLNCDLKGVCY